MKSNVDDILKRHENRKKHRQLNRSSVIKETVEQKDDFSPFRHFSNEEKKHTGHHPLFRKDVIMLQAMLAVCLFLVTGILFKHQDPTLDGARAFVNDVFHKEFQFTIVANWYEEQFGEPIALFPSQNNKKEDDFIKGYAVPVNAGTITETFNGRGIMLETGVKTGVQSVQQGKVTFVGNIDELGKTVKIQHPDGSESWYGKLETVKVRPYDFVKRGTKVGTVSPANDKKSGTFYFALKEGDTFVNPIKVIEFD